MIEPVQRLVCNACEQAHRWTELAPGRVARCTRCDAVMARGHRLDASALLALTLAALLLFLIALGSPLMTIRLGGTELSTDFPTALLATWHDGAPVVAALASLTAVLAPGLFIGLRIYLLLPLALGRVPAGMGGCMRVLHAAARWNTVAVLGVAALLSLVRIADMALARPGVGMYALGAVVLLLAAIESAGLRHLWPPFSGPEPIEEAAAPVGAPAAAPRTALGCACCGWVGPAALGRAGEPARCTRCGHRLDSPRALGLQRTWALLCAAGLMLLPANLLPMMSTVQALRSTPHTLGGGIAELWLDDAWALATLVFVASIVVPLLKIGALGLLAWSVHHAPDWRRLERARLYRLVEAVGHWSMLDVYVVLLLVGVLRFGNLAGAVPGPGLLAFAAVVVLTMLATHHFDPRWIWQAGPYPAAAQAPAWVPRGSP